MEPLACWLGRDTEADEHIVSTGTGITKVRTIRRQVPSKTMGSETVSETSGDSLGSKRETGD